KIDFYCFVAMRYQAEYLRIFKYNEYIDNNVFLCKKPSLRRFLHRRYTDVNYNESVKMFFNVIKHLYFRVTLIYKFFADIPTRTHNFNEKLLVFCFTRYNFIRFFFLFFRGKILYKFFRRFLFAYVVSYLFTV